MILIRLLSLLCDDCFVRLWSPPANDHGECIDYLYIILINGGDAWGIIIILPKFFLHVPLQEAPV